MPGSVATAKIDADLLAAVAQPKDALRLLRKEIKSAEKELAALVTQGADISAKATQLKALETQFKHVADLDKKTREIDKRNRQAVAMGKLANAAMTAQAVGNIVRGGVDAQSAFTLAAMAMQHERAIERAFGGKGLEFARRLAPALPLVGAGISSITEGMQGYNKLQDDMRSIGSSLKNGRLSKAQELLAQDVLTETWFGDPAATVAMAERAAKTVASLDPGKMRAALANAVVTTPRLSAGAMQAGASMGYLAPGAMQAIMQSDGVDQRRIDPDAFMAAADALYKQRLVGNKGALSKQQAESVLIETMADYVRNNKLEPKFLDEWTKQITEGGFVKMQLELSHDAKFMADDEKKRDAARERARFLPSRMEY